MTEHEIFTALYVLTFMALALLLVIGNVILDRIKQARADRAKERSREADLYARYQRMHEPPLDYDALQAELDAEFAALSVDKAARLSA